MSKTYVLQKDYRTINHFYKSGTEVAFVNGRYIVGFETFTENQLKEMPEWFKLKEEKTEVEIHDYIGNGKYLHLTSSHQIKREKYDAIKKAIEDVLNNDVKLQWEIEKVAKKYGWPLYTEKDLLDAEEKAFNAAREMVTFSNYKNSQK